MKIQRRLRFLAALLGLAALVQTANAQLNPLDYIPKAPVWVAIHTNSVPSDGAFTAATAFDGASKLMVLRANGNAESFNDGMTQSYGRIRLTSGVAMTEVPPADFFDANIAVGETDGTIIFYKVIAPYNTAIGKGAITTMPNLTGITYNPEERALFMTVNGNTIYRREQDGSFTKIAQKPGFPITFLNFPEGYDDVIFDGKVAQRYRLGTIIGNLTTTYGGPATTLKALAPTKSAVYAVIHSNDGGNILKYPKAPFQDLVAPTNPPEPPRLTIDLTATGIQLRIPYTFDVDIVASELVGGPYRTLLAGIDYNHITNGIGERVIMPVGSLAPVKFYQPKPRL